MTTIPTVINEAETLVQQMAAELTQVHNGECLCCYVSRQLDEFTCDGTHRHALRFRDTAAPRATALHERLSRLGACCDCELFFNAYEPHPRFGSPQREVDEAGVTVIIEAVPPEQLPACAGVRRGSLQPCTNWARLRRW